MIRIAKIIFLVGCIASFSISTGNCAPVIQDSFEAMIKEAIWAVHDLKVGDTRAIIRKSFELDGGLQTRETSRYMFKKCHYIKIDVEFSIVGDPSKKFTSPTDKDFPSEDIVKGISRPYLEYPAMD